MMTGEIAVLRPESTKTRIYPALDALAIAFLILLIAATSARATPKANELLKITSAVIEPSLKPGGAATLKVAAKVIDGWHINSNKPLSEDYIPTKLELNTPVTVTGGAVKYPSAQSLTLEFAPSDKLSVFSGDFKLEVPLKARADFAPNPGDLYHGTNQ